MKQFLRSLWTLLLLMMWCSVGFAAETTYNYTFKAGVFSAQKKTNTLNGVEWTLTTSCSTFGFESSNSQRGFSIGTNKTNPKNPVFSTSKISGTIKEIKVNAACNVKKNVNLEVTVNNVAYTTSSGSSKITLNSTSTDYTFIGNVSGEIKIKYTTSDLTAVYIKSISITYEEGPSKTPTTLTFPQSTINIEEGSEATFTGQKATLKTDKTELDKAITYAYSGSEIFATFNTTTGDATLKTGVYGTATVTATYAGDDTYENAEASYTVTVKNPNVFETTYDFVKNRYGYKQTENLKNGAIISNESPVTIVNTKNGSTNTRFWDNDLRNYKNAILTINAKEGCFINKITITGTRINQLNLNGENGTWNDGVWTGSAESVSFTNPGGDNNTVCFKTITIEYTAPAPLTLEENATDTDTKIANNNGKTVDVKLTRSLKAGLWNTICLPFDVTAEQVESVLKATGNVKEFDKEDKATATIFFKPATEMKAGVPYLIKPTEDAKVLNFKDVTINNVDELSRINGNDYCICGVFGKYPMKTNGTELFLNAAGKFVAPAAATNTMKGFRAYFYVPSKVSAAALNINIDGETTGINSIETEATVNGKVYNLNGQYVGNSLNGLKKGIYVVNGKKVIK